MSFCRVCNELKWTSVSSKCLSRLCWYCNRRCHNCMKPSIFGFTAKDSKSDNDCHHCSEHCQNMHFGKAKEIPVQAEVKFSAARQPQDEKLLLVTTCVLPTKMSPNTVFCLHIGMAAENQPNLKASTPYCIVQLRTVTRNLFLSFYITTDQSPGDPLWYCQHPDTVNSIDNLCSSGKVQEALSLGLRKLRYASLSSVILE